MSVRRAALVALLAVHFALAWAGRAPGVLTGQDDANYLVLADELGKGQYRDAFLSSAPVHRRYPPGYPAFLAALHVLPGDRADLAIAANVVLSTATLALAFALVLPVFGVGVSLAALAVTGLNPYLIDLAGLPRSEMLFAFLSVAALYLAVRADSRRRAAGAGALAISAALVRSVGVTLVIALGLTWLFQRRLLRTAALAATATVTVGAWLVFSFTEPESQAGWSYAADFVEGSSATSAPRPPGLVGKLAQRVAVNAPAYGGTVIPGMLPLPLSGRTKLDNAVAAPLVALGLGAGAVTMMMGGMAVVPVYVAGHLALLTVWPYQIGRYVVPLLVLIIPLTLGGLARLARRAGDRAAFGVVAGAVLITAGYATVLDARFLKVQAPCTRNEEGFPEGPCVTTSQESFFAALAHVRRSTPTDAVFFSAKPEPLYYYTGRQSIDLRPVAGQHIDLWSYMRDEGVSWVLLGNLQFREWTQYPGLLASFCERLAVERRFPPYTYLLRVVPDTAPPEVQACATLRAIDPEERVRDLAPERPR